MKFQCGQCDRFFAINNIHTIESDLEFYCDGCKNKFFINRNLVFSSSSKNSNILCRNCGKVMPEGVKVCDSCNLIMNKNHEELRIDNKEYTPLEITVKGKVYNIKSGKNIAKKKMFFPVLIILIFVLLSSLSFYYFKDDVSGIVNASIIQGKSRTEAQIVIMKSGQTYYADKIEKDGDYLKITNKNGAVTKVLKNNILQISKAVVEK
jgi:ribosomal protein S27E